MGLRTGALAWAMVGGMAVPGLAQNTIVPDGTLGPEPSVVTDVGASSFITGGAARGGNLFHSFDTFNVGNGNGAFFVGGADTTNIFSRVTGGSPSEIFGTLGTLGTSANLYFINPNGLVFGTNAALQVGGSFTATTASGVVFGDLGTYSAVDPAAPAPLLTVDPSAYFFSQPNPGSIRTEAPLLPFFGGADLVVPTGENLTLLGGDLTIAGADLEVDGGYLALAAVGGAGTVSLAADGQPILAPDLPRADITLTEGTFLSSIGDQGRGLTLTGDNIAILENSFVGVGVLGDTLGTAAQGGDVVLDAAGAITLEGGSIDNQVLIGGVGTGGDVVVTATSLTMTDQGVLSAGSFGTGDVGDVIITVADTVRLDGAGLLGASGVQNTVAPGAVGDGGDVILTAGSLEITNGAQIAAITLGNGDAGDVTLTLTGPVWVDGVNPVLGQSASTIGSVVQPGAVGNSGAVTIMATELTVTNGAQILANTFGIGDGGDLTLDIGGTVTVDGANPFDGQTPSGIGSSVESGAVGNGGTITITATDLVVINGAAIGTITLGLGDSGDLVLTIADTLVIDGGSPSLSGFNFTSIEASTGTDAVGDGGDITISTTDLIVTNGAGINSSTFGLGDAGDVTVIADTVRLDGGNLAGTISNSVIASSVQPGGDGNGGQVTIIATNLEVTNGAQILASTLANGNAGDVVLIIAETARFDGVEPLLGIVQSGATSTVQPEAVGNGGRVEITATTLEVTNGAQISAVTFGTGDAGDVILTIAGTALFDGVAPVGGRTVSGAGSSVQPRAIGDGGTLQITAQNLSVTNGAQILASTLGTGDAGDVVLHIAETARLDGFNPLDPFVVSAVFSTVEAGGIGQGGNVEITAATLEVTNGAQIAASTSGQGDGGDVIVQVGDTVRLDGINPVVTQIPSLIGSTVEAGGAGNGGSVQIFTPTLVLTNGAELSAVSSGGGDAGDIRLTVSDRLTATDGTIATNAFAGAGGQIAIAAGTVLLFGDSDIQTFVESGDGGGGNITLTADLILAFDDSDILAFSTDGAGGNITLNTPAFFGENFTLDSLTADPATLDGNDRVDINATGAVSGVISLPDTSLVENSLADLPDAALPTDQLVAGSCIAQSDSSGSFVVTGAGGIPPAPSDVPGAVFATGDIRATPIQAQAPAEPTAVFQLADGRLVLSRRC